MKNKNLNNHILNAQSYNSELILDVETTGINASFNDIIQFAAIDLSTDTGMSIKARPSFFNLPSPKALEVTGTKFSSLKSFEFSQYELSKYLFQLLSNASTLIAWNRKFDKDHITKNLFLNGNDPYIHARAGRVFICAMQLTSLASKFTNKIKIPIKENKRSHKLENVYSEHFQLDEGSFHDAHFDVMATKRILEIVQLLVPNLWAKRRDFYSKSIRKNLFMNLEGFIYYDYRNYEPRHYICVFSDYCNSFFCIDTKNFPKDESQIKEDLHSEKTPKQPITCEKTCVHTSDATPPDEEAASRSYRARERGK